MGGIADIRVKSFRYNFVPFDLVISIGLSLQNSPFADTPRWVLAAPLNAHGRHGDRAAAKEPEKPGVQIS